ncbi:MAG: DNA alkylation repair protein [Candidatus Abawacabacteria bacterium RBG_16_42_10]|uniref:DNA alkylation repair protein n=1 Tax=Candidatus Abawacabacteria bacterium RBG_16_42_10 TaxID=1817814 RepID=A0A1F4XJD0_9BACT|nr:MAG: DNA alkylation repair protein [Candidatus Abawacabacteria bacterium RBG_16_42_10]
MATVSHLLTELKSLQDKEKQKAYMRFFKTGKGEYGEGDTFWGITMPKQRMVAKKYLDLALPDIQKLLNSDVHECRMTGLLILTYQFNKASDGTRKKIADFYIRNTKRINNWDLVDVTTPRILGKYLLDKDRKILYTFAQSKNLWERRIAIITTQVFISEKQYEDTLNIAELLLTDKHDLIHKAVGWMLREVGKYDQETEEKFLRKHYKKMPRTMLRYAIEKFPEKMRKAYLLGKV